MGILSSVWAISGVIGGIFNSAMSSTLQGAGVLGVDLANPYAQLGQISGFTPESLAWAFSSGLLAVFVTLTVLAAATFLGAFALPREQRPTKG
jgi:hypothetical protein